MSTPDTDDFDELPPCIGERMRDAFHSIFANQHHAAQHSPAKPENTHVDERN